ncbi:hypothetical protein M758_3G010500 [Ceratodon purpureus]|nr:hypothetical protein M758_3G010500 [Ceratodon purpureus]KAG0621315.1 hypothetical protein M758_3G010500 [Ceratodon purpureus]KAG0621316.1 hypothetical protein M758_3G010500 [Ceratodon purpureus]
MAAPRYSRIGERPNGPSATLIIVGSLLVGALLIGAWVLTAPAAIAGGDEGTAMNTADTKTPVDASDVPDTSTEEDIEKEAPADELPAEQDAEPATSEDTKEEPAPTTEDESSESAEENVEETTSETAEQKIPESVEEKTPKTDDSKLPDAINPDAELNTDNVELNSTKFETQADESQEEKVARGEEETSGTTPSEVQESVGDASKDELPEWKLCSFEGAQDYIPCLDNKAAIKKLTTTKHYEHRERHCPTEEELPKCLLPLPSNYKVPIKWPESRDAVWFSNVPHTELASYKSDQNWVKVSDNKQKLIFPGGGTQFKSEHGALHYIEYIEKIVPDISWGKHVRTLLDVGCGVASFGGYLFDRNVLAMSLAPKDEHKAQIQFALERGIPAINSVMGTQRLVFPSNVYDVVHCARCRVPWEIEGGMLLLELNRLLRPGGFFIWSATPVYWDNEEDTKIWNDTSDLLSRMQWTMLTRSIDPETKVGVAIFQKPKDNDLYALRSPDALPPFCEDDDKPDAAWYVPMKACMHKIPSGEGVRGTSWPADWPLRVESTPTWLSSTEAGVYGKPAAEDFRSDTDHWKRVVHKSYMQGLGIDWTSVRKVMDMKAGYGGFAAALITLPLWTMNIVPVTEPDTLPIIFDRGLIGMYHDWCEPHSTYPRSYDVMHSDHLLSTLTKRYVSFKSLLEYLQF